jgi:hypothetical protein
MRKNERVPTIALYFIFIGVILICILYFFYGCKTTPAVTTDDIYLKQSSTDPRRTVIYGGNGNQKGYLQQSPIDPRITVEYDKHGNVKGYWKQDPIDSRKSRYYKKK